MVEHINIRNRYRVILYNFVNYVKKGLFFLNPTLHLINTHKSILIKTINTSDIYYFGGVILGLEVGN